MNPTNGKHWSSVTPMTILAVVAVGMLTAAALAGESVPKAVSVGETVELPRAEYRALKRDAELYRTQNRHEGLAIVLFTLFGVSVTPWKLLGYVAATLFAGRWLVQMYYSRKAGRPVIPRIYWVVSMVASVMLLSYWTLSPQRASVGVLQNLFPSFVAGYNLFLDIRYHRTNGVSDK